MHRHRKRRLSKRRDGRIVYLATDIGEIQRCIHREDYAKAERLCGTVLNRNGLDAPRSVPAYLLRAKARLGLAKYQEAEEDATHALKLNGPGHNENIGLYIVRAKIRNKSGNFRGAEEDADAALALASESLSARRERALARYQLGQLLEAEADARWILARDPAHGLAARLIGDIQNQMKRFSGGLPTPALVSPTTRSRAGLEEGSAGHGFAGVATQLTTQLTAIADRADFGAMQDWFRSQHQEALRFEVRILPDSAGQIAFQLALVRGAVARLGDQGPREVASLTAIMAMTGSGPRKTVVIEVESFTTQPEFQGQGLDEWLQAILGVFSELHDAVLVMPVPSSVVSPPEKEVLQALEAIRQAFMEATATPTPLGQQIHGVAQHATLPAIHNLQTILTSDTAIDDWFTRAIAAILTLEQFESQLVGTIPHLDRLSEDDLSMLRRLGETMAPSVAAVATNGFWALAHAFSRRHGLTQLQRAHVPASLQAIMDTPTHSLMDRAFAASLAWVTFDEGTADPLVALYLGEPQASRREQLHALLFWVMTRATGHPSQRRHEFLEAVEAHCRREGLTGATVGEHPAFAPLFELLEMLKGDARGVAERLQIGSALAVQLRAMLLQTKKLETQQRLVDLWMQVEPDSLLAMLDDPAAEPCSLAITSAFEEQLQAGTVHGEPKRVRAALDAAYRRSEWFDHPLTIEEFRAKLGDPDDQFMQANRHAAETIPRILQKASTHEILTRIVREDHFSEVVADVTRAFAVTPRHLFMPRFARWKAYADQPVPIGYGQTISQPTLVYPILAALDLDKTKTLLQIGTGSGWLPAAAGILAKQVYTMERQPFLAERAGRTIRYLGRQNITVINGDGGYGYPTAAPYGAILVSAEAPDVPAALVDQLAEGGVLIIPITQGDDPYASRRPCPLLWFTKRDGLLSEPVVLHQETWWVPFLGDFGHPTPGAGLEEGKSGQRRTTNGWKKSFPGPGAATQKLLRFNREKRTLWREWSEWHAHLVQHRLSPALVFTRGLEVIAEASDTLAEFRANFEALKTLVDRLDTEEVLQWSRITVDQFVQMVKEAILYRRQGFDYRVNVVPGSATSPQRVELLGQLPETRRDQRAPPQAAAADAQGATLMKRARRVGRDSSAIAKVSRRAPSTRQPPAPAAARSNSPTSPPRVDRVAAEFVTVGRREGLLEDTRNRILGEFLSFKGTQLTADDLGNRIGFYSLGRSDVEALRTLGVDVLLARANVAREKNGRPPLHVRDHTGRSLLDPSNKTGGLEEGEPELPLQVVLTRYGEYLTQLNGPALAREVQDILAIPGREALLRERLSDLWWLNEAKHLVARSKQPVIVSDAYLNTREQNVLRGFLLGAAAVVAADEIGVGLEEEEKFGRRDLFRHAVTEALKIAVAANTQSATPSLAASTAPSEDWMIIKLREDLADLPKGDSLTIDVLEGMSLSDRVDLGSARATVRHDLEALIELEVPIPDDLFARALGELMHDDEWSFQRWCVAIARDNPDRWPDIVRAVNAVRRASPERSVLPLPPTLELAAQEFSQPPRVDDSDKTAIFGQLRGAPGWQRADSETQLAGARRVVNDATAALVADGTWYVLSAETIKRYPPIAPLIDALAKQGPSRIILDDASHGQAVLQLHAIRPSVPIEAIRYYGTELEIEAFLAVAREHLPPLVAVEDLERLVTRVPLTSQPFQVFLQQLLPPVAGATPIDYDQLADALKTLLAAA